MFEKLMAFAESGKGRRLLNALNKKNTVLSTPELDEILTVYRRVGLPIEVASLKSRRGILRDDQYDDLAGAVRESCSSENLDDFRICLRNLLSSGMKMNPTKMEPNGSG